MNDTPPSDNYEGALDLLQQAAEGGCKEAIRDLGHVYEKGYMEVGTKGKFVKLVEVDLKIAFDLYSKAV